MISPINVAANSANYNSKKAACTFRANKNTDQILDSYIKQNEITTIHIDSKTKQLEVSHNLRDTLDLRCTYLVNKDGSGQRHCFGGFADYPKGTFDNAYKKATSFSVKRFLARKDFAKDIYAMCDTTADEYDKKVKPKIWVD